MNDKNIVSYANMAIVNNSLARNSKNPKPTSINQMLNHLKNNYELDNVIKLNLAYNLICDWNDSNELDGINIIIEFIIKNLKNLKILNLSGNHINPTEETIILLNKLLNESSIEKLVLKNTKLSKYYENHISNFINDFTNYKKIRLGIKF